MELNEISIVPFTPEYTTEVIDLILSIQRGEFDIPITAEDQPDLREIPSFYQKGGGNFWIALHEGTVVGTLALLDIGDGQAALRKMFVHQAFRGPAYGTARRLLSALMEWAGAHHTREIYLGTTSRYLAAHRFYEKNGFSRVPAESLPESFPRMSLDTRFYVRVLGQNEA